MTVYRTIVIDCESDLQDFEENDIDLSDVIEVVFCVKSDITKALRKCTKNKIKVSIFKGV